MNETGWDWARLDRSGIALLREIEAALSGDIVLVYRQGAPMADPSTMGLEPAALSASELASLQGVEQKLGAVAVAYTKAH